MWLKLGVELVPYKASEYLISLAKLAEREGFDHVWVCDHYHHRYVHSVLAQLAGATKRVKLGPGVTNPFLVHPAVTAAAIATLNEISNGRAVLGISSGDPLYLSTVGVRPKRPVVAMREAISIIRELLAGKRVDFSGEFFGCHGAAIRFKGVGEIPIYVGGRGARMLELAGSVADGALINASHPDDLRECIEYIKKSIEGSGRRLERFDVAAYTCASIHPDLVKARTEAKRIVAFVASSAPRLALEHHGIAEEDMQKVRLYLQKGNMANAAAAVTDRMIDVFSVCRTPSGFAEYVREVAELGVTQVVIGAPIGPEPPKAISSISKALER